MINVFVDTNIFLDFYHFSNEDLEHLTDLLKLIELKKVNLYITEQVINEFNRNRESKIQDAIKRLNSSDSKAELPQMCLDYPEAKELKNAEKLFKEKKKQLITKVSADINNKSLKADQVIAQLFKKAEIIATTDSIHQAAKIRAERGNPPGKIGSLGDAINWEALLEAIPAFDDLNFVTGDSDYSSPLNEYALLDFLKDEWTNKKGKIVFYKSFNQFLKANFSDIKLITEDFKSTKIDAFRNSPSFDAARARLGELVKINDFTTEQIIEIVDASVNNNQIYWAHPYSPELIGGKLEKIIDGHEDKIPYDLYHVFCDTYGLDAFLREEDLAS
jgi:predicted nucleic acid-binding protein